MASICFYYYLKRCNTHDKDPYEVNLNDPRPYSINPRLPMVHAGLRKNYSLKAIEQDDTGLAALCENLD